MMTENDRTQSSPRRAIIVWLVLVAVTSATFWLGSDHPFSSAGVRVASTAALTLAFVKVWFIGMDFMEIRHAPAVLRAAFLIWLLVIGGGLVLLHAF